MFLPTTLQSAEHIVKAIDELKAKVPSDPLEADLIAMAEMIAEEDKKPDCLGVKIFTETPFVFALQHTAIQKSPAMYKTCSQVTHGYSLSMCPGFIHTYILYMALHDLHYNGKYICITD